MSPELSRNPAAFHREIIRRINTVASRNKHGFHDPLPNHDRRRLLDCCVDHSFPGSASVRQGAVGDTVAVRRPRAAVPAAVQGPSAFTNWCRCLNSSTICRNPCPLFPGVCALPGASVDPDRKRALHSHGRRKVNSSSHKTQPRQHYENISHHHRHRPSSIQDSSDEKTTVHQHPHHGS